MTLRTPTLLSIRRTALSRLMGLLLLALIAAGCGASADDPAAQLIREGEALYTQHCAACHGFQLEGQSDWRLGNPDGTLRSPPHDETGHTWHHGDGYLRERIRTGTATLDPGFAEDSNMPAFGELLNDREIDAILVFIKSTWSNDIVRRQQQATELELTLTPAAISE